MSERVLCINGNQGSRPLTDFFLFQGYGKDWFVNSGVASSGSGRSWNRAFKTITEAVAAASAGDRIFCYGSFSEAVVVTLAGLVIIGVGPTPYAARWTGAADAKCLTITAAGVKVSGFRFTPPAYSAGIPAGIYLYGAPYADIRGNRFQGTTGSWYGVYTNGDCDNAKIEDNEFLYFNTATYGTAIKSSGAADISGAVIQNNRFHSNLNHIVAPMKQSFIMGNVLPAGGLAAAGTYSATLTVLGIDVHGGATGYNKVTRNDLGSLYHQACYYPGTGDEWSGNFCVDRTHGTQVDATTGISILAPAA